MKKSKAGAVLTCLAFYLFLSFKEGNSVLMQIY